MDIEKIEPKAAMIAARADDQIDALTSLRFFAAIYVLFLHSGTTALTTKFAMPKFASNFLFNGYLGVNFFFVLSGFILAYVYCGKLDGPVSSAASKKYGIARFARVYPVYLLALLLTLLFVPTALDLSSIPQFLLLQSWVPPVLLNVPIPANDNGPAWTLSIELFFYILFPTLIVRAEARSTTQLLGALVAICALMAILRLPSAGTTREAWTGLAAWLSYVPTPILRTPEFLYGMLLGLIYRRGVVPAQPWMLYACLALTLAALGFSNESWMAGYATILFGLVILLVAVNMSTSALANFLQRPFLVLLGGASYAIYLLQFPVHRGLRVLLGPSLEPVAKTVYVPTLIGLSILVFLYCEGPARSLIKRKFDLWLAVHPTGNK